MAVYAMCFLGIAYSTAAMATTAVLYYFNRKAP